MRIVIGKGKIIILAITLLLLLIFFAVLFLYYKSPSSSSIYTDIYSSCEKTVENGKNTYTCYGFLKNYLDKDTEECFVFDLTSSSMVEKMLCEKKGYIKWNKEDIDWGDFAGSVIPINIIFSENKIAPIKGFNTTEISINRLEDEKISPILNKLNPVYEVGNILTQESQRLGENGYTTSINKEMELGYVYFKDVSLERITKDGDFLLVKFSTIFKGEQKEFTVKTSGFAYRETPFVNEEESKSILVDTSNYMNYSSNTNLNMTLIYIPESSSLLEKDLNTICADEQQVIYPVCFYLSTINSGIPAVTDVDKTLADIAKGDGFLKPFILMIMSKND